MRRLGKQCKKTLLFKANDDTKGHWFGYFSYINPDIGKFECAKVYENSTHFKTKSGRTGYNNNLITLELLKPG